jgi:transcriptional regulator with GAF, ATPase, and Fis domain
MTIDSKIIPTLAESGSLARTFVDVAQSLSQGQDSYEVLSMLSERCVELLPVKASGILIKDQAGILQVIAASNPSAHLLDLFQIQNEEGPCFECCGNGKPVSDTELASNGPWPRFANLARNKGFHAAYALPLQSKGKVLGALNLFAEKNLTDERVLVAQTLADAATLSLLQLDPVADIEILARKVFSTIEERNIVEQAKGMISQRFSVSADFALVRIRSVSDKCNCPIIEVARAIVERDVSHPSHSLLQAKET